MNFEEFLREATKKMAPQAAFDLSRDVRIETLQKILLDKKIATKEEIDCAQAEAFSDMAKKIRNMPPPPSPKKMNTKAKSHD